MRATREEIARALRTGISDSAVARHLRCDRHRVTDIRKSNGYPRMSLQTLTLEEKWWSHTLAHPGGHLEWTGSHAASGTPIIRYRGETYTAARIAYRIRHGRDPEGYARAECGVPHCVAPADVDDLAGRQRTREQLRYLVGHSVRAARCVHGHDQNVHGLYEADGRAYCGACKAAARAVLAHASRAGAR